MKRHSTLGLLIAAAAMGGAAAAAEGAADPQMLAIQSEAVRYDAAEIRDRRSAKVLFFRIRQAAEEVCRISNSPRGYERWYEHDCEAEAVAEAVRDAGLPALDDYYRDAREGTGARR